MTSSPSNRAIRSVLTTSALVRLLLGWGAFAALMLAAPALTGPLSTPLLLGLLAAIIAVIVVCAFGVVTQAERLAHRLGDPYGTLVLTLSIVFIEVILISAVMLGPGEHATIGRDSVMAVSMIILNLVVGVALLVAGLRHGALVANRTGATSYLAMIIVLSALAFVIPTFVGDGGSYAPGFAVTIAVLSIVLYVFFLQQQMGPRAGDYQEVLVGGAEPGEVYARRTEMARGEAARAGAGAGAASQAGAARAAQPGTPHTGIRTVLREHRVELVARAAMLVLTVVPIVLLSHEMAALLDDALDRLGAPVAMSGLLIALIVFLPETITTVRAAFQGEMQRVSNLTHGALVSTVGLTIPAVLVIGLATEQTVVLAESPVNLALLVVSILLTIASFSGKRITAVHGAAHLLVFVVFAMTMFA